MATKQDEKIQKLFEKVQAKKDEIAKAEKPCWLTNCSFAYDENSAHGRINLHTVSDVDKIVKAMAFLISKSENHGKAAKMLGIKTKDFTWMGYPVEAWTEDFKTRIIKIQLTEKKKELEAMEKTLDKLISPERRAEMELEAIEKALLDD